MSNIGNLRVVALVRKHGAIGMFYRQEFTLKVGGPGWREEWFNLYQDEYELHHFEGVE